MSTTIERVMRFTGGAMVALMLWGMVLLALPFFGGPGRQVAVVADSDLAVRAVIAAGGRLIDVRDGVVLARSDHPGFAAALYREGALLVVEGRVGAGCVTPPAARG